MRSWCLRSRMVHDVILDAVGNTVRPSTHRTSDQRSGNSRNVSLSQVKTRGCPRSVMLMLDRVTLWRCGTLTCSATLGSMKRLTNGQVGMVMRKAVVPSRCQLSERDLVLVWGPRLGRSRVEAWRHSCDELVRCGLCGFQRSWGGSRRFVTRIREDSGKIHGAPPCCTLRSRATCWLGT